MNVLPMNMDPRGEAGELFITVGAVHQLVGFMLQGEEVTLHIPAKIKFSIFYKLF